MNKNRAYIEYKQSLLKEFGVKNTLVKDELIIDLPEFNWERFLRHIETATSKRIKSDSDICTYCHEHIMSECRGCIVMENDIKCNYNDSNYDLVVREVMKISERVNPNGPVHYGINEIDGFTQKLIVFIKENLITKK